MKMSPSNLFTGFVYELFTHVPRAIHCAKGPFQYMLPIASAIDSFRFEINHFESITTNIFVKKHKKPTDHNPYNSSDPLIL